MNITRSSKHLRTTLSLAAAVLLGSCAQMPFSPNPAPIIDRTAASYRERTGGNGAPRAAWHTRRPSARSRCGLITRKPIPWHPATHCGPSPDGFCKSPWQWRQIWRKESANSQPQPDLSGRCAPVQLRSRRQSPIGGRQREEVPLLKLSPEVRVESLANRSRRCRAPRSSRS
jgi:hypothetical protein